MLVLPLLLFIPAQVDVIPSMEFSRNLQINAVVATVHVMNKAERTEGSGVVVGRDAEFVYILTARHIVGTADRVTVSRFSTKTYPKIEHVYDSAKVVAVTKPLKDLALVRLEAPDEMLPFIALCPPEAEPEKKSFQALSVGCSNGAAPTCMIEKVIGRKKVQRPMQEGTANFWEVEHKQITGRSGGPLVNERGYLIGICSGTNRAKSYFCHPTEIRSFLAPYNIK